LAGHPIPDAGSLTAGRRLLAELEALPESVSLLVLLSGGTSSLLEVPVFGVGLAELQRMNGWLLASGLPIDAVNRVRKSVSLIKGGGLLTRLGRRPVRVLAISDVPGDDPAVIGSGLLVPEVGLREGLRGVDLPDWLRQWVDRGLAERGPLPTSGPRIEILASLATAMRAAAATGRELGLPVHVHDPLVAGDAARVGRELARGLIEGLSGLHVWGGETTVCLPPDPGRGGRNQHLALAAAIALAGHPDALLLAVGTDGTDGPTEDAGALVDAGTLERAGDAGLDARAALDQADAGTLLAASGDLIQTGPTGTNVMDLILGYRA
jgi:hydroxypyruvate reductase